VIRSSGVVATVILLASSIAAGAQTLIGNPNASVTLGDSTTSTFKVFNLSNMELLRVQANGNVAIGTTGAPEKLTVGGSIGIPVNSKVMFNSGGSYYSIRLDPTVFNLSFETNGADRMVITPAGNVGIGTTSPSERLMVSGNVFATGNLYTTGSIFANNGFGMPWAKRLLFNVGSVYSIRLENVIGPNLTFETDGFDRLSITPYGKFGFNTTAPTSIMDIVVPSSPSNAVKFIDLLDQGIVNGISMQMPPNGELHVGGIQIGKLGLPVIQSDATHPLALNRDFNSDVVIGAAASTTAGLKVLGTSPSSFGGNVTVTGNIVLGGTINAQYQDVAEWVPATVAMKPGTVVVLNPERNNEVMPSAKPYDTTVAGVVSARPGVILGIESASKAQIATTGRVKVHVHAGTHGVKIGDLLVTSDRQGMAMVSQPLDIGGIAIHRPGTLIGKALEPLASGEGDVLVLLSLQ
jgi:hypothetical protein